jgi:hypothetical protein
VRLLARLQALVAVRISAKHKCLTQTDLYRSRLQTHVRASSGTRIGSCCASIPLWQRCTRQRAMTLPRHLPWTAKRKSVPRSRSYVRLMPKQRNLVRLKLGRFCTARMCIVVYLCCLNQRESTNAAQLAFETQQNARHTIFL